MIPLRLYIYAACALALAGILYHDHYVTKRLNATRHELSTATATIVAERENTRKEHESAKRYAARLAISRGPRSPPPRIMCRVPSSVPATAAASGTDDAPAADNAGVFEEVDIGPRIDVPFRACEENLIKLDELQRWINAR